MSVAAAVSVARRLLDEATNVVTFSGAGLSVESGVPTFRDAPDALWARYDPMDLASPQGFARAPQVVCDWYASRRRAIAAAAPNPAHRALAARDDWTHVTQNVDDLLHRAGARGVIHLHGTIAADRCHGGCGHHETIDLADPPPRRDCPACGAAMRPAVVWFGETLPPDAWEAAETACRGCDVLLVVGTSAVVYPAAGLIGIARAGGAAIVVVDTAPGEAGEMADVAVVGRAGEIVPRLAGCEGG